MIESEINSFREFCATCRTPLTVRHILVDRAQLNRLPPKYHFGSCLQSDLIYLDFSGIWNQLPASLRIPHPNYSSPSQRPSFKHAGLTCYTLLSPFITFHCFTLSSKPTFLENLILHLSLFLSVGLTSWL